RRVLLRVYPWDRPGDGAVSIARALVERGVDVAFSVPQNRALASDPARWAAAMDVIAGRFAPLGRQFQIGQAINRSKWGVWTIEDYYALVRAAAPRLRRVRADVEIVGPPIIDFEYEHLAAAVN